MKKIVLLNLIFFSGTFGMDKIGNLEDSPRLQEPESTLDKEMSDLYNSCCKKEKQHSQEIASLRNQRALLQKSNTKVSQSDKLQLISLLKKENKLLRKSTDRRVKNLNIEAQIIKNKENIKSLKKASKK